MNPAFLARSSAFDLSYAVALTFTLVACGGGSTTNPGNPGDDTGVGDTSTGGGDTGVADTIAGDASPVDVGPVEAQADGAIPAPRRLACVPISGLGKAIPVNGYGALEGELVHIEAAGSHACDSNSSHVVLQVQANSATYEIAIDIGSTGSGVGYTTKDIPATLPAQGWTVVAYDYVSNLGLHSTDMPINTPSANSAFVVSALANTSFLTIHGRGYTDGTGAHDVHRNSGDRDGVLILHGQGAGGSDRAIAFRFDTDTF
ncbi:MAG: hypothetical protein ACHREM_19485 [Polyangiales bacterium]